MSNNNKQKKSKSSHSSTQVSSSYINFGNQPGHPYVLEIWPKGHSSPLHNHRNAQALIKLLYGKLKVNW